MTVDALMYVGRSRFGYELSVERARSLLDRHSIDTALVAPIHRPDGDFARGNSELAGAVDDSGGRMRLVARVDPWDGDAALDQLTAAVRELGAVGLLLHPAEEHFVINHPVTLPLAWRAAELGVPIVVASGYQSFAEPVQVAELARRVPGTKVVLTNGGQYNISGLSQQDADLALGLENVYVHSTGVYRDDWVQHVVERFGAERLLFASAAPHMDVSYELRRVQLAHIADEAKPLILDENARRVFRLDKAGH